MKIYDAENQILGRLCSVIAKNLLNGEDVFVVNADKAALSGKPKTKMESYLQRFHRGDPIHGPFFPRRSDEIFRRTVRGMLPWDRTRGRNAYRKLKVFVGVPDEFQNKTFEKVKIADVEKLKTKFITLREVSKAVGGKV